jgi:HK97 gp10 family phage protein
VAKIQIKGEAELIAKLKRLPEALKAAERRAVKAQTEDTAQDLRWGAPVLSGDLQESIQEEILNDGLTGRAAITARHAEFVIHGTSDTPANDFVTPVIARTERDFPDRLREEIQSELKRL